MMLLPARFIAALSRINCERAWEIALLLAIVLAGAVAISPNVADPDLWGHVQYGRDTLQYGLAKTTTYSYIAPHETWINHENLMEIALAWGADTLGPLGLVAIKLLAGAGLLLVLLVQMRRQNLALLTTAILLLLTASGLARYWSLRPQLFSFVAYAGLLSLLSWIFAGWEGSWQLQGPNTLATAAKVRYRWRLLLLWTVPLLMAAWTNAHGGFLAGECIYTAYLVLRGCEFASQWGYQALGMCKRFALMIFVAWLATFFTPYGYKFHLWLWQDLSVPRPEIIEWLPPNLLAPEFLPLVLLMATFAITLCCSRLSFDFTHLVILALTLWQSLSHERHIPFFAISVAYFLPRHVENVLRRFGIVADSVPTVALPAWLRVAFPLGIMAAFGLLGSKLYERLSELKVQRHEQPLAAVEFIARHHLQGRMVCAMNWAQYVLYACGPHRSRETGILVQIDGRLRTAYSQAMLDAHFDFILGEQSPQERYRDPSTPFDATRVLHEKQPNLVLIDQGQPHAVQVMERESRDWALLYQDAVAQLWGRRARYDDPNSPDFLPPSERQIGQEPQVGHVGWPAFPATTDPLTHTQLSVLDRQGVE